MTTGERIAQKRHEKGWTQHDLAKKLGLNSRGIHVVQIGHIELF